MIRPVGRPRTCRRPNPEEPLARYYKSSDLGSPIVYVQDEGQWRGYLPDGSLQRSAGILPEVIVARTVEITRDDAEALMAKWFARARMIQGEPAAAAEAMHYPQPDDGPESGPAAETRTLYGPAVSPRRLSRRLLFALAGAAALIVIVVVSALAGTGHLGIGSAGPTTDSTSNAAGTTITSMASQDVVATVGGHPISRQQLDQRIAEFEVQYDGQIPDKNSAPDQYKLFQLAVLDYLVAYQLADQAAPALGIGVTEQEVQEQMALILKASFGGDQTKFESAVAQQGLTLERFKQIYKESMLFNKVYAEVTKAASVTDNDIQAYYDQHTDDSYAGKSLDDVRDEIRSTLVDAKQKKLWRDWLARQRQAVGVKYANGWSAPAEPGTPAS